MYRNEDSEDLKNQIFHLKKQLLTVNSENHLLKVKVRKLQDEILKKDKQIDAVLDPKGSSNIRQILYERSASFLLNTKEKSDRLQRMLVERDNVINRLQNQLDAAKLYSQPPKRHYQYPGPNDYQQDNSDSDFNEITLKVPSLRAQQSVDKKKTNGCKGSSNSSVDVKLKKSRSLSWTPGLHSRGASEMNDMDPITLIGENMDTIGKPEFSYDIKDQYRGLSRDHLLSIIENLKNNQRSSPRSRQTSSRKSSPESDLDRIEVCCNSPHEEIQQLHLHFLDMISEVDRLKGTIFQLQNDQQKTENVLKKKDNNIDQLVEQVKSLSRPKSRTKSNKGRHKLNSNSTITSIYSGSTKSCNFRRCTSNGNNEISKSRKTAPTKKELSRKVKKDAMIQVGDEDDLARNQCRYIENSCIIITKKPEMTQASQTSIDTKESVYEDEVFEEGDSESERTNINSN